MSLETEPGAIRARRWLQRIDPRWRVAEFPRPDADHLGAGQPGGHQPVLGLGRLHHQPRNPGAGGGLALAMLATTIMSDGK